MWLEGRSCGNGKIQGYNPILPTSLTGRVILGRQLILSRVQSPYLYNGDSKSCMSAVMIQSFKWSVYSYNLLTASDFQSMILLLHHTCCSSHSKKNKNNLPCQSIRDWELSCLDCESRNLSVWEIVVQSRTGFPNHERNHGLADRRRL